MGEASVEGIAQDHAHRWVIGKGKAFFRPHPITKSPSPSISSIASHRLLVSLHSMFILYTYIQLDDALDLATLLRSAVFARIIQSIALITTSHINRRLPHPLRAHTNHLLTNNTTSALYQHHIHRCPSCRPHIPSSLKPNTR
jgi:hypothetical protein